jgi:ribose transport system permease protein
LADCRQNVKDFARGTTLGLPNLFWAMLVVAVVIHYFLSFTRTGRYLYAMGSNAEATRRQGISTLRITIVAYVISSGLAALASVLLVSRLSIASPSMANAYELQAIAAAVVGGASLFGGRGTVLGALVGAILFTTMSNGAVLLNVDPFWEMVLEGLLIALVVYLDNLQKRRQSGGRAPGVGRLCLASQGDDADGRRRFEQGGWRHRDSATLLRLRR